jgi:hypothetical protein
VDPDRLAELEDERRFLLSSIRDLEREHAVGDVDEHDFGTLRDGYVARAAAVLREIEDGRRTLPDERRRPVWQRVAIPVVTLAVGIGLGVFVSHSAGQRLPGQGLTGGQPLDRVTTLLAQGRGLLGSDPAGSLAAYRKVLEIEPNNVEARTYAGWLVVLNGQQAKDDQQIQQGISLLRAATNLDDTFADPHCFIAVASARFLSTPDQQTASTEAQACLDRHPPANMVPMIQGLLPAS